ncbi:hypothetical protein C1752_04009 [Acaryochloris thomasi RCC1774]|uniref:Uncharacterized protein n=1 Tax=Acaryochloris thomasi RCC1774 TaxID=1764569 RepID=A0A2W1JPP0_9CYAN|nr:type IV pilin-like G/H family protein [Acaryochloris thomasi]PZD72124.1 hypothetical protein C1752_04009 [Acaryochloris thomasi RCC1774]
MTNLRLFPALLLISSLLGCTATEVSDSGPASPEEAGSLTGPAREQEGKVSVSTLSKAQQAFFLENSRYAESLDELDIALAPKHYELEIVEVSNQQVITKAVPIEEGLKSYITGVSGISQLVVCASDAPGKEISSPVFQNEAWACGPNSTLVE